MNKSNSALFGTIDMFALKCTMFRNEHDTEIGLYIKGRNILEFERNGKMLTTRWNLDDLVEWLRNFLDNMKEDPYPVECDGKYAACKDIEARNFDSDDQEIFDAYYDRLEKWSNAHCWYMTANGAIIADLYFQLVGEQVEISWNNTDAASYVKFSEQLGGASINKQLFVETIDAFIKFYADYWFC